MSFWEILEIISSIFGIYSFIKSEISVFPFLKNSIRIKKLIQIILKPVFSFLEFVFSASLSLDTHFKKNLNF